MQRRSLLAGLAGILAAGVAPAVVAKPMKLWVPKQTLSEHPYNEIFLHSPKPFHSPMGASGADANINIAYQRKGHGRLYYSDGQPIVGVGGDRDFAQRIKGIEVLDVQPAEDGFKIKFTEEFLTEMKRCVDGTHLRQTKKKLQQSSFSGERVSQYPSFIQKG